MNPERSDDRNPRPVEWYGDTYEATSGTYPYREGDFIVLGPELFAGRNGDETVLCWRGENYAPQRPTLRVRLHNLVVRLRSGRDGDGS